MAVNYEITITDDVRQRAERLAELTGYSVAEIIPALVMLTGGILSHSWNLDIPAEKLSDDDVIAISNLHIVSPYDERFSELLYEQQARDLNKSERNELDTLLRVHAIGMLYQSEALVQAVQRGLREPLQP